MHDPANEDDRQFETWLKGFEPVAPAPLPVARPRYWQWYAGGAAAAAAALAVALLMPRGPVVVPPGPAAGSPMTFGNANALLVTADSWKSVIDDAGFHFRAHGDGSRRSAGRSAIRYLSQEDLSR